MDLVLELLDQLNMIWIIFLLSCDFVAQPSNDSVNINVPRSMVILPQNRDFIVEHNFHLCKSLTVNDKDKKVFYKNVVLSYLYIAL